MMVWGAITYDSKSLLVTLRIFQQLNDLFSNPSNWLSRHWLSCDISLWTFCDTLRLFTLPFLAYPPETIFQHDNERPYSHFSHFLKLPPCCCYFSFHNKATRSFINRTCMEHNMMSNMVSSKYRRSRATIEGCLEELLQDEIMNIYHSLHRRIQTYIAARRGRGTSQLLI